MHRKKIRKNPLVFPIKINNPKIIYSEHTYHLFNEVFPKLLSRQSEDPKDIEESCTE